MAKKRKKVVVIGGGTGTFTVLTGLKKYPLDLTAIVSMADDGGSTGRLRDELGVLPPGDVRQCLVALSTSDRLMRELMNYRFEHGKLKGHSFGNLLLSALEKTTGSFDRAVEKASDILRTRGRVVPATLDKVTLVAKLGKRTVRGEQAVRDTKFKTSPKLSLSPKHRANPKALAALREADVIIIGPGSFYTSVVPDLLVNGMSRAICKSRAKKIYICNLMSHAEHTSDFTVADYTDALRVYLGCAPDVVIFNNTFPPARLLKRYAREGDKPTSWNRLPHDMKAVSANLISRELPVLSKSDKLHAQRTYIRHNPTRLAQAIMRAAHIRVSTRG